MLENIRSHSFKSYLDDHKGPIKHPIITSFLKDKEHYRLFKLVIDSPTPENKKSLDDSFKNFYSNVRLTSYLSKTIYFNAINFDKTERSFKDKNILILEKPIKDGESDTLVDILDSSSENIETYKSDKIEDHIANSKLYEAIQKLTNNQRQILSLAYVSCLNDTEIAKMLNKSQQAVSKSHKKALDKLKKYLENA